MQYLMFNKLRVLIVEPHKAPYEAKIRDDLTDLQKAVGGYIEIISNGDGTLIVCNEEGKLNGMEGNRRIEGDVIAGPFFVVGEQGAGLRSLTKDELAKYKERFKEIEDISQDEVDEVMHMEFYSM